MMENQLELTGDAPSADRRGGKAPSLTIKRRCWLLFLAASDLYAVPLVIFLALRLLTGERVWFVALFNNFLHWLLLPSIPLLAVALLGRRWQRAAPLAVNVLAFSWLFGGLFLPNPSPTCHNPCLTLTVMSYNINADNATPDRLIPVLRDSGADVIALQEVGPGQAATLETSLLDEYPYRVLRGYGIPGIGLLSRFPLAEYEVIEDVLTFPYMVATLNVDGQSLAVINGHPPPPARDWRQGVYYSRGIDEIRVLLEHVQPGEPTLMLGDFNATDQGQDYKLLTDAGLADAFREGGWGFGATFPAARWRVQARLPNAPVLTIPLPPLVRIDYIWYTGHFDTQRAWVGAYTGSDHLPVLAELIWYPARQ